MSSFRGQHYREAHVLSARGAVMVAAAGGDGKRYVSAAGQAARSAAAHAPRHGDGRFARGRTCTVQRMPYGRRAERCCDVPCLFMRTGELGRGRRRSGARRAGHGRRRRGERRVAAARAGHRRGAAAARHAGTAAPTAEPAPPAAPPAAPARSGTAPGRQRALLRSAVVHARARKWRCLLCRPVSAPRVRVGPGGASLASEDFLPYPVPCNHGSRRAAPARRRPRARPRTRPRRAAPCSGASRGAPGARPAARCCRPRRRSWTPCRCPSWAWCCRCGLAPPGTSAPCHPQRQRVLLVLCHIVGGVTCLASLVDALLWADPLTDPRAREGSWAALLRGGERAARAHAVEARRAQEEAGAPARWRARLRAFVFEAVGHLRIGQVRTCPGARGPPVHRPPLVCQLQAGAPTAPCSYSAWRRACENLSLYISSVRGTPWRAGVPRPARCSRTAHRGR